MDLINGNWQETLANQIDKLIVSGISVNNTITPLTSEYGVNSYSATTGPLWTGNVFTGAGEQNDYAYVSVNLQVDEAGILTFQFSQDGVNWSSYPTTQFSVASGINEVHGAFKGTRWVRPYFSGTTGTRTYFRIRTMYSNSPIQLSAPINQSISSDADATIVRAVGIGQEPNGTYSNERKDGEAFKTQALLGANSVYTSDLINTDGYTQIETRIYSNVGGVLVGRWYSDASKTQLIRTFTRPYANGEVGATSYFSAPMFGDYLEYTYTNGSTPQTNFNLELHLTTKSISGQILGINDYISPSVVANLGRSVIVGQDAAGNFRNSTVDAEGHLKVHIDEPLSAFGELRTAEITPLLQVLHPYELNYDLISSGATGSGSLSYDSTNTLVEINSGAASSSSSLMKTNSIVKYRNGQGLLIRFTCIFDTPKSGNTQFAGWGDSDGGFFFGYSGTTFGVNRRYNGVDNFIPQTQWYVDQMDGVSDLNNPSGQLLDPTKGNVYEMQIQWLGFGAVRFNIESNESGQFEPAHVIQYTNQNVVPTVTNPSFPILFESKNTTNTSNIKMKTASMSAFVEGRVVYTGRNYSFRSAKASGTNTNMFTIIVPTIYKGKTNRSRILLKTISVIADGNNPVSFQLVKNGTITAPTYNQVSTYSITSGDTAGTYTAASGRILYTLELNKVSNVSSNIEELEIFVNAGETLSIIANGVNAGSAVGISWVEDI